MPEPRETHTAIDARRDARGGGEREVLAERDVAALAQIIAMTPDCADGWTTATQIAKRILAAGWVPAASPATVFGFEQALGYAEHTRNAALAERDALAATVARVRDLLGAFAELRTHTIGDHGDTTWGDGYKRALEHVDTDLRAALAPSDPATDTGGEGDG